MSDGVRTNGCSGASVADVDGVCDLGGGHGPSAKSGQEGAHDDCIPGFLIVAEVYDGWWNWSYVRGYALVWCGSPDLLRRMFDC